MTKLEIHERLRRQRDLAIIHGHEFLIALTTKKLAELTGPCEYIIREGVRK